jgi:abequosyltransferase
MPSNRPLLTIAIPTYNRAESLRALLDLLGHQINNDARVELIVSDNASTDATSSLIRRLLGQGIAIRYIRNETNLGADRNIIQCFESAAGKYVWIFSDDDLMAPGTVSRVLDAVANETFDLVYVTPYFFNEYRQHKEFSPTTDITCTSARDFANRVHVMLTFISGLVVNKDTICGAPHRPFNTLFDSSLAQLGPFFTALNRHRRSLIIRDPLVAATANTSVGYALYKVFGTNLTTIANEWLDDPAVRKEIFNGTIQRFLPFWIFKSRKDAASTVAEDPHQVLRACFGSYSRYWIYDYPVCTLPLPLAGAWITCLRAANKVEALLASTV